MKISKFTFWIITAGALFFSSCGNEELAEEQQNLVAAPSFSGTIGQLADANPVPQTRSGVIEDNENYAAGEKFYWHDGDKAKVLFFPDGDINSTPVELIYTATVAEGVKSNTCQFSATGSVPAGNYTVYALYPADNWYKDETGYKALFKQGNIIPFSDASSTHLKDYMFMKADAGNMTITGAGDDALNLSFKHLTSVVRFHITSDYNATSMELGGSMAIAEKDNASFFHTAAYLNSIDGMDMTPASGAWCIDLHAQPMADLSFVKTGSVWVFDCYMPVFPTAVNMGNKKLKITTYIIIDENYFMQTFGTENGLSFTDELSFMPDGFEAGKSYYFNLKVDDSDLPPITGTSYAVGDYWPDATNPEGIVFWVKPGSSGSQGKVVGLNEIYVSKWGPNNDEDAAGVTGIRSLTDGATATKSMIAKYKSSGTFATDYPAFHYVYNTVNSDNESGAWYLPARDEMKMLLAGYSGKVYESIVDWTSGNMPSYNSAECQAVRTAFNTKLTDKGGDAFGSGENSVNWWYLSSSEMVGSTYYSFNFKDGLFSVDPKSYDGNIRWIREF